MSQYQLEIRTVSRLSTTYALLFLALGLSDVLIVAFILDFHWEYDICMIIT